MPRREDDVVARGRPSGGSRTLLQAGGFVLAVGATLAVFLTENAQLLRIAVVAVAWAFVLATVALGRRDADRVRAAAREAELRRAYELELEREVAARREYELELENELRRETEGSMREELDALRGDIASLTDLRDEVARVSALRGDIAALGGLRDEVARVAALRDDVLALTGMREELGQLAALREDMGRLRAELAEQLSSEMLVERIVMRTQASRVPGEAGRLDGPPRTLDAGGSWSEESPPRELTGGWPAIRLDEPRPTQQFEQVRTSTWSAATPPAAAAVPVPPPPARPAAARPVPRARPAPAAPRPPVPPAFDRHDRAAAHEDDPYLGSARSWRTAAEPPSPAPVPVDDGPRRRRTDDDAPVRPVPGEFAATTQHPAAPPAWAAPQPAEAGSGPDATDRLARILAENGVSPSSGGRRRRRYREDGESDDVLARVLGRS
ncbi:DUF6779 domain-containing protein [Blastococcus montanus]|uniref:DUF6779 domain-containing protein n=1 Tax=Blastococcus montanus TaxID=3144973 RepID=UPI0032086AF7